MRLLLIFIFFCSLCSQSFGQKIEFLNPNTQFVFPLGTPLLKHKPLKVTYYKKQYKNYQWEEQWHQYNTYDYNATPMSSVSYDELNNRLHTQKMSQNSDSTRLEVIKWESVAPFDSVGYDLMLLDTTGKILYYEKTYGRKYEFLKHARDGQVNYYFYDANGHVDSSYHRISNHRNNWQDVKTSYRYENKYDSKNRMIFTKKFDVDYKNRPIQDLETREATWYSNNRVDTFKSGTFALNWTRTTTKHLSTNTNDDYLTESWQGTRWYFYINSQKNLNGTVRYDSLFDFSYPNDPMITNDSLVLDKDKNILYRRITRDQTGRTSGGIWDNTILRKSDGTPIHAIYIEKRLDGYETKWQKWEFEGQAVSYVGFSEILTTENRTITLYPNPVQSTTLLNVSIAHDLKGKTFSIKDLTGKTVMKAIHQSNQVDISNLKAGIFFYQLEGEEHVEKFVVK